MKSKTIIISSPNENKNGRGILTVFQDEDLLKCRLRLYNVDKLSRHCKLGIYHEEQVYSANLLEKNGVYETSMVGDFDIDKDFYTAIVNTQNSNEVILAGGTYQGYYFNDNSVITNSIEEKSNIEESKTVDTEDEVCEQDCDKCAKCKYKEFFYSNITHSEEKEEEKIVEEVQKEEKNDVINVINSIIPQFDYIFNNYNADEELNSLINNSKFVKINENQEQYSIGAIYDGDELKYICYAIKRDYNVKPPDELGEHYQWLPIDREDPLSEGYYIVFQDAKDLKILEL